MKKTIFRATTLFFFLSSAQNIMAENPVDIFRGTGLETALQREYQFLWETHCELAIKEGCPIYHVWNPDHSIVIFWYLHPSAGSICYSFWVYKKLDGEFNFFNRYSFQTRHWIFNDDIQTFIFAEDGFSFVTKPTKEGAIFTKMFRYENDKKHHEE